MKILQLFNDYNVQYQTEGHKHCTPGWVNMECPFCTGNPGLHLGFHLHEHYFKCWRCGWHPVVETIAKLTKLSERQAREIVREYKGPPVRKSEYTMTRTPRLKAFKYPSNTDILYLQHQRYLENRGFDPFKIENEWGVLGTGPVSSLDGIDYKHRLIIPIYWDEKPVSFQGRTISTGVEPKYLACPIDRELVHHQNILYGRREAWAKTGICVEGPTDVWRLGTDAFAIFGIGQTNYSSKQVRLIAQHFERVAVIFDADSQGIKQANKLVSELLMFGVDAFFHPLESGDPADLSEDDAQHLVQEVCNA
jgi:hypothetical protein